MNFVSWTCNAGFHLKFNIWYEFGVTNIRHLKRSDFVCFLLWNSNNHKSFKINASTHSIVHLSSFNVNIMMVNVSMNYPSYLLGILMNKFVIAIVTAILDIFFCKVSCLYIFKQGYMNVAAVMNMKILPKLCIWCLFLLYPHPLPICYV